VLRAKYLLNLDNEEQNTLCIGCAGGLNTNAHSTVKLVPRRFSRALTVRVSGLTGGHSGIDIHRGRGNAILILGRALLALKDVALFDLTDLNGGVMRNVIPREATAVIVVDAVNESKVREALETITGDIRNELGRADPGLQISTEAAATPGQVMAPEDAGRILDVLACLPNGVLSMSPDIEGLVQTSTNIGTIHLEAGRVEIATLQRSSVNSARLAAGRTVQTCFSLAGFEPEVAGGYPGWKPEPDSDLVQKARQAHEDALGRPARLIAMHAGLECGVIGEKYPGMQMISLGPEIVAAHSPGERVEIRSVEDFWHFLTALLERL
jgi:dipeptidase D